MRTASKRSSILLFNLRVREDIMNVAKTTTKPNSNNTRPRTACLCCNLLVTSFCSASSLCTRVCTGRSAKVENARSDGPWLHQWHRHEPFPRSRAQCAELLAHFSLHNKYGFQFPLRSRDIMHATNGHRVHDGETLVETNTRPFCRSCLSILMCGSFE